VIGSAPEWVLSAGRGGDWVSRAFASAHVNREDVARSRELLVDPDAFQLARRALVDTGAAEDGETEALMTLPVFGLR
jgi:hypothetical protein